MDRLAALTAFVAIADLGSFSAAARHLRVSPQAVTRAIAGLEAELGVLLLHRSTRAVRLTEDGALYLEHCRVALSELETGAHVLRGHGAVPQGMLTITAPVVFGRLHVVPVVTALLAAHSKLQVRMVLVDRFINLVEEGIDVAVRIGDLSDSALRVRRIGEVRRLLVASPAYLARRGEPQTPDALPDHDLIVFEGLNRTNAWRFGPDERQVVELRPRIQVTSADAAIAAAEASVGIVRVLSYMVARQLAQGTLKPVLNAFLPPSAPVNLVYSASRTGSVNVRAFIEETVRSMARIPL